MTGCRTLWQDGRTPEGCPAREQFEAQADHMRELQEKSLEPIRTMLEGHISRSDERHEDIRAILKAHHEFINGNGVAGAKVRLDRLEQRSRLTGWIAGLSLTGVLGTVTKIITDHWPGNT